MNIHERIAQHTGTRVQLIPLKDLSPKELWFLYENPWRTCQCCGGEGWHHEVMNAGPFVVMRSRKCHNCDAAGMQPYVCFN